jgi:hypothetical protein
MFVSVDVLAFAPFGAAVAFVLVFDDASGVLTPVLTRVSLVGVAFLLHGIRVASRGSQLESDLAGVAVLAFTPAFTFVLAPMGDVDVFVWTAPFAEVAGVVA